MRRKQPGAPLPDFEAPTRDVHRGRHSLPSAGNAVATVRPTAGCAGQKNNGPGDATQANVKPRRIAAAGWSRDAARPRCCLGCHGLAPWSLTFVAIEEGEKKIFSFLHFCSDEPNDPRGKPVGLGCHGLAPWYLTFAATEAREKKFFFLPLCSNKPNDPRGKPVGLGCHGLAPWYLTFAATEGERKEVFLSPSL